MMALIVLATGVAVSLSFFHLARGLAGFTPAFDRDTLDRIGLFAAFAVYCCAGPALLMRAFEHAGAETAARRAGSAFALTGLIFLWSGALGVVAVESARALL